MRARRRFGDGGLRHRHGRAKGVRRRRGSEPEEQQPAAQALLRQRRRLHPADASRGRGVPVRTPHPHAGPNRALRQGSRRVRPAARLVGDARARPPRVAARSDRLRRTDPRNVADGLLRDARRQSRRLLPDAPPQPPDGLDGRCAARALELRVAREAQRRPSHLHQRGRLRRGHHPDAVRTAHARPGAAPVVPAPALLHLGALLRHGAAVADRG